MAAINMPHAADGPSTPSRLRRLPSRLLAMAAARADRLVTAGLANADAHKWHYAVLAALDESGPASQSELSGRTGIFRSDLVAVLNELEERDFLRRAPDPADRRRNVISMTSHGARQLARLDKLMASLQDDLLAPLSPSDREELIDLLSQVVADAAPQSG